MSFLQTYYTSCETGLRGGKGFQFNAASEGIDQGTFQQIERLGLYVPPVSLPSRPTDDEIEQFPISLLYQRLANGNVVVAQAQYKGMDYSGRFGNFFTHTLISTYDDLRQYGILPIELWMSEAWAFEPLATIELPLRVEMPPGNIQVEEVFRFLAHRAHAEILPGFLTAVVLALSGERRIVIVDEDQKIAMWIAAACYALPAHLALQLTFNTYVKNPYQTDFLIIGTTSDSDFRFSQQEMEHQFYVFDFEGQRFSKLPEISIFAELATRLYENRSAEMLADFAHFIERIAPDLPSSELDAAIACYTIKIDRTPSQGTHADMVKWLAERLTAFTADEVQAILHGVLDAKGMDQKLTEAFIDLYLATCDTKFHRIVGEPCLLAVINASEDDRILEVILQRLPPLDQQGRQMVAPFRKIWLKKVGEAMNANYLRSMFQLADRCGFLEFEAGEFTQVGRNVFGPLLREPAARETLLDFASKPAFGLLIEGIGEHFSAEPQVSPIHAEILSHPTINRTLALYAEVRQNPRLYLRLIATSPLLQSGQRLQEFLQYVQAIRNWGERPFIAHCLDEAFQTIWQGRLPTENDSVRLIEVLRELGISGSCIPGKILDSIFASDIKNLSPQKKELINLLTDDKHFFHNLDQPKQALLEAYMLAVFLETILENKAVEAKPLWRGIEFLDEKAKSLSSPVATHLAALLAMCIVLIKIADEQYEMLRQGFDKFGKNFFTHYGDGVIAIFEHPSDVHCKVMASWFTHRVVPELRAQKQANNYQETTSIYTESFRSALRDWRSDHLIGVEKQMQDVGDTCRLWKEWRKGNSGLRGMISGLFKR